MIVTRELGIQLLFLFGLLIGIVSFQNAYSETVNIGPETTVIVGADSTITIDSDSENHLNNKGTLNVEDSGKVLVKDNGNFLNDCGGVTNLANGGEIEIGEDGVALATLTNHGALNGPGQINLFGLVIEIKNSGFISAIINPNDIMQIVSPCSMAIGGEFIGIDSTALLLYYSQNTASWMIPVIVSGIGIGIVIARKF